MIKEYDVKTEQEAPIFSSYPVNRRADLFLELAVKFFQKEETKDRRFAQS